MARSSLQLLAPGLAVLCAFQCARYVAPAQAQTPSTDAQPPAEVQAAYHDVVRRAIAEFDVKHYAEARALFLHAHELWPSARTLRTLGMTAFELRIYSRALDELQAALDDPRRPLDGEQRSQVLSLLERTRAFVGRYRVQLTPPEAELLVDGVPRAAAQGPLVLAIGEHSLVARANGYGELRRALVVQGREDEPLVLGLEPVIAVVQPAAASAAAPEVEPLAAPPKATPSATATGMLARERGAAAGGVNAPAPERAGPNRAAALTAFGVGTAGFIGSGVFTVLALNHRSDLGPSECPNLRCPEPYQAQEAEMKRFADFATAGFALGVAGAALGAYLWISGSVSASDSERAAGVRLRVSPGSASVAARF